MLQEEDKRRRTRMTTRSKSRRRSQGDEAEEEDEEEGEKEREGRGGGGSSLKKQMPVLVVLFQLFFDWFSTATCFSLYVIVKTSRNLQKPNFPLYFVAKKSQTICLLAFGCQNLSHMYYSLYLL